MEYGEIVEVVAGRRSAQLDNTLANGTVDEVYELLQSENVWSSGQVARVFSNIHWFDDIEELQKLPIHVYPPFLDWDLLLEHNVKSRLGEICLALTGDLRIIEKYATKDTAFLIFTAINKGYITSHLLDLAYDVVFWPDFGYYQYTGNGNVTDELYLKTLEVMPYNYSAADRIIYRPWLATDADYDGLTYSQRLEVARYTPIPSIVNRVKADIWDVTGGALGVYTQRSFQLLTQPLDAFDMLPGVVHYFPRFTLSPGDFVYEMSFAECGELLGKLVNKDEYCAALVTFDYTTITLLEVYAFFLYMNYHAREKGYKHNEEFLRRAGL